MSDHISKFISDIAVHFSPPKYERPEERDAWLRSMVAALRGSSAEVLERAAQVIIDNRKNKYFPLVAECRQAIREAAEELRFDQHVQTLPQLRQALGDEWSTERVKLAYDLIQSAMGRQAAQDNPSWVLALWHFCRRFQRLPDDRRYEGRTPKERLDYAGCSEIDFCKKSARDFDEAYENALRGVVVTADGEVKSLPLAGPIQQLGASMLAKRDKLRNEVLSR